MVTSLDGRSTRGSETDNHTWTSPEDQKHFMDIIENAKLMIMGSKTFDAAKANMKHKEGKLRIIITRTPEKYENEKIDGQLEFTNEAPEELVGRLESQGFSEALLVGGAHTNTEFLKLGLVSELWQTLEPKILGMGNGIVGDEKMDVSLKLISEEKLNNKGTLLLKYGVI